MRKFEAQQSLPSEMMTAFDPIRKKSNVFEIRERQRLQKLYKERDGPSLIKGISFSDVFEREAATNYKTSDSSLKDSGNTNLESISMFPNSGLSNNNELINLHDKKNSELTIGINPAPSEHLLGFDNNHADSNINESSNKQMSSNSFKSDFNSLYEQFFMQTTRKTANSFFDKMEENGLNQRLDEKDLSLKKEVTFISKQPFNWFSNLQNQIIMPQYVDMPSNPMQSKNLLDKKLVESFETELSFYKYERNNVAYDFSMALKADRELRKKSNFLDTFRSVYYQYLRNPEHSFYYFTKNMSVLFFHQKKKEIVESPLGKKTASKVVVMAQHKNFSRTLQKHGIIYRQINRGLRKPGIVTPEKLSAGFMLDAHNGNDQNSEEELNKFINELELPAGSELLVITSKNIQALYNILLNEALGNENTVEIIASYKFANAVATLPKVLFNGEISVTEHSNLNFKEVTNNKEAVFGANLDENFKNLRIFSNSDPHRFFKLRLEGAFTVQRINKLLELIMSVCQTVKMQTTPLEGTNFFLQSVI